MDFSVTLPSVPAASGASEPNNDTSLVARTGPVTSDGDGDETPMEGAEDEGALAIANNGDIEEIIAQRLAFVE